MAFPRSPSLPQSYCSPRTASPYPAHCGLPLEGVPHAYGGWKEGAKERVMECHMGDGRRAKGVWLRVLSPQAAYNTHHSLQLDTAACYQRTMRYTVALRAENKKQTKWTNNDIYKC